MADKPDEHNPFNSLEKQSSENCVEYLLFVVGQNDLDRKQQLLKLEHLRKAALNLYKDLALEYIWQRDEFNLELKTEQGLAYLHGVTDYGDSVEDEWLIVYLLRELTRTHPNVWVRVFDSDGEFLLIEAANVLPNWLNPEIDQHRSWICNGKLLIVPPEGKHTSSQTKTISLLDALRFIMDRPSELVQSDLVDSEAFYRLEKYPTQIQDSLHHSIVTVPRRLAAVLHDCPKAIAPAMESFYLRDALSLKPLLSSSTELHFPPTDLVSLSVRFTRVLFAQLRSQRFDPPARWADVLPRSTDNVARFRAEMGMKLTCGFEMMINNIDKTNNRAAREAGIVLDDLKEDGNAALPTDDDIKAWKDSLREDDEAWMDINYEDFERELEGKGRRTTEKSGGFGSAATQADLQKLVSRFEAFLNDETAGLDGAEVNDMDMDNDDDDDDDDSDSDDSDGEDKAVSFDEEQFARMMREMMGLPPDESLKSDTEVTKGATKPTSISRDNIHKDGEGQVVEGEDGITELAAQMEAELNEYGALKINETRDKTINDKGKGKAMDTLTNGDEGLDTESDDDGDLDIDYNLAKNLLESFKSQAGMAGPTGNILGMLGMQLPRDEDDGHTTGGRSQR